MAANISLASKKEIITVATAAITFHTQDTESINTMKTVLLLSTLLVGAHSFGKTHC